MMMIIDDDDYDYDYDYDDGSGLGFSICAPGPVVNPGANLDFSIGCGGFITAA